MFGLSVLCLRKAARPNIFRGIVVRPIRPMPKKRHRAQRSFEELLSGLSVLCLRKAAHPKIFRGLVVRPIRPMPKKGIVLKDLSRNFCQAYLVKVLCPSWFSTVAFSMSLKVYFVCVCVGLVVRFCYCYCIVGCCVVARVVFVLFVVGLLLVVVCWLLICWLLMIHFQTCHW